jgi:hypothetical protein
MNKIERTRRGQGGDVDEREQAEDVSDECDPAATWAAGGDQGD